LLVFLFLLSIASRTQRKKKRKKMGGVTSFATNNDTGSADLKEDAVSRDLHEPALCEANNAFGLVLWKMLIDDRSHENVFISPLSIATVLAMASCGASKASSVHRDMRTVLNHRLIAEDESTIMDASRANMQRLAHKTGKETMLSIANSASVRVRIVLFF
jgi:serine protease inhibitor